MLRTLRVLCRGLVQALVLVGLVFFVQETHAADSINVQEFRPPAGMRYAYTESASSDCPESANGGVCPRWMAGANYDFLHNPLVELNVARDTRRAILVKGLHSLQIGGGYVPNRIYSLHATVPMHVVNRPGQTGAFALGDIRLFGKLNLWPGLLPRLLPFNLTIVPDLKLPTGRGDLFVSDGGGPVFGLMAVGERALGDFHLAVNWGYRFGTNARYQDIYYRQKMPVGAALSYDFSEQWAANLELQTQVIIPFDRYQNPSEMYLGGKYSVNGQLTAHLGAGIGSFNGVSSADWRIMTGIRLSRDCFEGQGNQNKTMKDFDPNQAETAPIRARVAFTKDQIHVLQEIRFSHGKALLTDESKDLLNEVSAVIKEHQAEFKSVHVEGHTNKIGSAKINLRLSKARAKAVKEYMQSQGIPEARLTSEGYGYEVPREAIPGYTEEQMLEANRRVEFKVKR